jgi:hypothetical protein
VRTQVVAWPELMREEGRLADGGDGIAE